MSFKEAGFLVSRAMAVIVFLFVLRTGMATASMIINLWMIPSARNYEVVSCAMFGTAFVLSVVGMIWLWTMPWNFTRAATEEPIVNSTSVNVDQLGLLLRRGLGIYFVSLAIADGSGIAQAFLAHLPRGYYDSWPTAVAELVIGAFLLWSGRAKVAVNAGGAMKRGLNYFWGPPISEEEDDPPKPP